MLLYCIIIINNYFNVIFINFVGPEDNEPEPGEIHLMSAIPINSTAVKLNTSLKLAGRNWSVDVSETDGPWKTALTSQGSTVLGLEPLKTYYIRVKVDGLTSNTVQVTLPAAKKANGMCEYKGKNYTRGKPINFLIFFSIYENFI